MSHRMGPFARARGPKFVPVVRAGFSRIVVLNITQRHILQHGGAQSTSGATLGRQLTLGPPDDEAPMAVWL